MSILTLRARRAPVATEVRRRLRWCLSRRRRDQRRATRQPRRPRSVRSLLQGYTALPSSEVVVFPSAMPAMNAAVARIASTGNPGNGPTEGHTIRKTVEPPSDENGCLDVEERVAVLFADSDMSRRGGYIRGRR